MGRRLRNHHCSPDRRSALAAATGYIMTLTLAKNMGNHFCGLYHWEFTPVEDRDLLLDALHVFCDGETNLFIEVVSPSLLQRFRFWRMRSHYRTHLIPDMLSPRPSVFHVGLCESNLRQMRAMLKRDGLHERSIAHIKVYRGELGLAWFHGFCDAGDDTLCCSRHVDDATIEKLQERLKTQAEKKFGELKSDRERRANLERIFAAMERYQGSEIEESNKQ